MMRLFAMLCLAVLGLVFAAGPAAAVGSYCSVSGSTTVSIGDYNPFTGAGFYQRPVNLTLTRYVSMAGVTQKVDFYLRQPAGSPAYDVAYQGSSVLYTSPDGGRLSISGPSAGTVYYDFGGTGQPNTVTLPVVVTIPPGLDLPAGEPVTFDMVYICRGSSGLADMTWPALMTDAITIRINVQSALQASYAGPALDFGEIGSVADAAAGGHSITGQVRVASTGPYRVSMTSANSYRMTFPGGDPGVTAQRIRYKTRFLGQTLDLAAPTFSSVVCSAAHITGQNLPLTATLEEGGQAKAPSPDYRDTLTVTVTPLVVPYGGTTRYCPSL